MSRLISRVQIVGVAMRLLNTQMVTRTVFRVISGVAEGPKRYVQ